MSERLWPIRLALAGAIALTGGSCVLGDLFRADGLEQVKLDYAGPPNLKPCDTVPFSVTVEVDGSVVRNARVSLTWVVGDSVVELNASKDTLMALNRGAGEDILVARFSSSMLLDGALTLEQPIRVSGNCS